MNFSKDLAIKFKKYALPFFVLWALFLSFEFWAYGPFSYVKMPDAGDHILASRLAIKANIADRENGNWRPDIMAGVDDFAQADSLGVIDWLFVFLPGWAAYGLLMFVQRFVAGYFVFKLLNVHLKLSVWACLIPALFYSLFSENFIHLQFEGFTVYDSLVSPGLPLLLYVLGNLANGVKLSKAAKIAAAFGVGILFANISAFVFSIFLFPLLIVWLLLVFPRNWREGAIVVFSFCLGWFALEIFSIAATFLFSQLSQRGLRDSCIGPEPPNLPFLTYVGPIIIAPTILLPLLIGLVCVIPKVLPSNTSARSNGLILFALILAYIFAVKYVPDFVCGPYNVIGLPHGLNLSRFYFYIPFLTYIFLGLGLETLVLFTSTRRSVKNYLLVPVISLLVIQVAFHAVVVKQITLTERGRGSNYANLYLNPYLQRLSDEIAASSPHSKAVVYFSDKSSPYTFAALWPYGINTIDGYTRLYTSRFSSYWQGILQPMMELYPGCRIGIKHLQGNNRVILSSVCELSEPMPNVNIEDLYNFDLLSLAGVKYIASSAPIKSSTLAEIKTDDITCEEIPGCTRYYLYENSSYLEFVNFFTTVSALPSDERILERIESTDMQVLAKRAFVNSNEVNDLSFDQLGASEVHLAIEDYSSDEVLLSFSSATDKIITLAWAMTPDWSVTIDGNPQKLFAVDTLLIGVLVPSGQHEIRFTYSPKYTLEFWLSRLGEFDG